jgi:hypothetical protein
LASKPEGIQFMVRDVHTQYPRRYDQVLFSVKDVTSVVNAVLKKDGMLYGMHITIAFLLPFDLSNENENQRPVIQGRTE